MTVPTRQVCDSCFGLIRGFGSMARVEHVWPCAVCGRNGPGHVVHANAADHCHRRLCAKLEKERAARRPCGMCEGTGSLRNISDAGRSTCLACAGTGFTKEAA